VGEYLLRLRRFSSQLGELSRLAPAIMVAAIATAAWGQHSLVSKPGVDLRAVLLMAGGGLAFLAALVMGWRALGAGEILDDEREEPAATGVLLGPRQRAGLAVGIFGGLAGFYLNDGNGFSAGGFLLWLLGCLALPLAFWPQTWPARFRLPVLNPSSVTVPAVLLLTIALAAFLRFYHLDSILREQGGDHAGNVLNIRLVRDGGHPVYFPAFFGQEPLFFYLGAALSFLFGYSFLTIKVASAIAGVATVAATYFMTRELFGNRRVALIAAILVSLSFWHIIMSRYGWRDALHPLTTALTLLFLFRALKYNRGADFVFAGLFLGLGLYGYRSSTVVPIAAALALLVSLLSRLFGRREELRTLFVNSVLLVLTALVVYAPLGRFALDEPDIYFARVRQLSVTQAEDPVSEILGNTKGAVLMFNWQGGFPAVPYGPHAPELDYFGGAAFALGVGALALFWLLRRRALYPIAALSLFVLLIPTIGSLGNLPQPLYAAGVIPLVFAIAALPLYIAAELIARTFGRFAPVPALALLGVALGLIGYLNHQIYFDQYVPFNNANAPNTTEYAAVFRDFAATGGDLDNAYLKSRPYFLNWQVLAIEMGYLDWGGGLSDIEDARLHTSNADEKLYVVNEDASLHRLQGMYPQGSTYRFESSRSQPGVDLGFFVFLVPAAGKAVTPLPNTHLLR